MQVRLACPPDLVAAMNASLLEQAVVNLIENAVAYSPPEQSVEVWGLQGERDIEIRVRDYGCGIGREHLPRIFERFYRVDKSRSRDSGGTGLPGHRQAHRPAPQRPHRRREHTGQGQHVLYLSAEYLDEIVGAPPSRRLRAVAHAELPQNLLDVFPDGHLVALHGGRRSVCWSARA